VKARALPAPAATFVIGGGVLLNLIVAVGLAEKRSAGVALALLPIILVAFGVLTASSPSALFLVALGLDLFAYPAFHPEKPVPLPGALNLYAPDLILLVSGFVWGASWLLREPEKRPRFPRTPVLGWPLLLFAGLVVVAVVRGHERYGEPLLSIPLRLFLYGMIAMAMADLTPRKAYRCVVAIFYVGAVYQAILAVYLLATGGTTGDTTALSTGGVRPLANTTAIYLSGSLLLALLNLQLDSEARRNALHLAILGLSAFGLLLTFQRTTFAVIGVLIPVLLILARRITSKFLVYLPLCAPFIVVFALILPQVEPQVVSTFTHRITSSPSNDTSAKWREKAISAVFVQVRESPFTGVGFGRKAQFTINGNTQVLTQDPHDQYIYLWAGGGLVLLGSFVLLMVRFLWDALRRLRWARGTDRVLLVWAVSLWFVFLVNAGSGVILTTEDLLLVFWVLLLIPSLITRERSGAPAEAT
jgi:O-antigen ligase